MNIFDSIFPIPNNLSAFSHIFRVFVSFLMSFPYITVIVWCSISI